MKHLVVGVDGTDVATAALTWAADTVGFDGQLHVVLAMDPWMTYLVDIVTGDVLSYAQVLERDLMGEWTSEVRDRAAIVTTEVVERNAWTALSDAAVDRHADAVVVGAHVSPEGMPQRLGRTTRNLLRKLPCPLIVVPGCVDSSRRIDGNAPIVVGMGHSDATEAAVKWAADLGDTREATVAMVHATGDAPVFEADSALDLANYVIHPDDRTAWSNRDVDRFAGEVQELSEHDLDVRVATPPGLPAVRLAEASTVASLLVIGQHWSTLTAGHHVTQPLRYALTHARCPVAVVPEWCGAS